VPILKVQPCHKRRVLATSKEHSFGDRDRKFLQNRPARPAARGKKVLPEEILSSDTFPGKVVIELPSESNRLMQNYDR